MITVKVIRWEMLVLSEQGPKHALTKLVLMKLAQYKKTRGRYFRRKNDSPKNWD